MTNPQTDSFGARAARSWWSPADERWLLPRTLGIGWDINFGAIAVRLGLIEPDAENVPFESTPDAAFRAAVTLPALCAAATVAHYVVRGRSLPDPLPSNWGLDGRPNRWQPKRWAAATDLLLTVGSAGVASWTASRARPASDAEASLAEPAGPERAGTIATAAMLGTVGAVTTVLRSLPERRRLWVGPALVAATLGSAAATLFGLAVAGRDAEIKRDLAAAADG